MLQIEVTITGTQEVISKLRKLNMGLLNFAEPLGQIGEELKNYFSNTSFSDQGGNLGHPWPALAKSTIAYKKKHYRTFASKPLIATGTMQRSFTSDANATSVTIGNTATYFKYHQSSAPRHKIPYRPMIGINDDVKSIVKKILEADIARKIETL